MDEPNKSYKKSYDWLKPHQFGPGNNANPNGRPKGKTLKEFAREYLQSLPDDRKIEYLATLPEDIIWKMAEGNPANSDTSKMEITMVKPPNSVLEKVKVAVTSFLNEGPETNTENTR